MRPGTVSAVDQRSVLARPVLRAAVLMGGAMFAQFRLNPAPPDPMQAKIMQFMPLVMTGMMAVFPVGTDALLADQHGAGNPAAVARE